MFCFLKDKYRVKWEIDLKKKKLIALQCLIIIQLDIKSLALQTIKTLFKLKD